MIRITDRNFFKDTSAKKLAEALLGKIICRVKENGEKVKYRISVTEAYPEDDPNTHAKKFGRDSNGYKTQTKIGGTIYCHKRSCFDIVAGPEGVGEGVLIRGGINVDDPAENYHDEGKGQPGKLGKALSIENLNGEDICVSDKIGLWRDDESDVGQLIEQGPRVNVSGEEKLRFYISTDRDKL